MAEILAPVGGPEQLYAAVRCGANAVYLGTKGFNARRNASNFNYEELSEAVKYCHVRDVSVYVTVNTLIYDDEMSSLVEVADAISNAGVDGVIIQDMAVLDLFKRCYPSISRIASTQMAIHNVDGAKKIEELGFDTLVLARELSKEEIAEIVRSTSLKTEVFIHGAHCMSLSGACYVSSMLGGRSGNRGLCAQPCRLDWKSGVSNNALSLKDLSLLPYLKELENIGVDSFKIEGRMKRPEYVAAVVTACKRVLSGESYDVDKLQSVFSRSGFTDGYYKGNISKDMFGTRTKEDVLSSAAVLKDLERTYDKEQPIIPVDASVSINENGANFELKDDRGNSVCATGIGAEKAISRSVSIEDIKKGSIKLGGTPFYIRDLNINLQDNIYYPLSEINRLRREAVELLIHSREYNNNPKGNACYQIDRVVERNNLERHHERWGRFANAEQIREYDFIDKYIIPISLLVNDKAINIAPDKVIVELPSVVFPKDEAKYKKSMLLLKERGYTAVYVNNLYGVKLASDLNLIVHGGFGLNVTNSEALRLLSDMHLHSQTVSFELSAQRINEINSNIPLSIIAYGRVPLMRYRACPIRVSVGCNKCLGNGEIKDRYGNTFPVECNDRMTSSLLNSVPIYIFDKAIPRSDITIYWFTTEDEEKIEKIIRISNEKAKPDFDRTTGLYYREVL